MRGNSVAMVQPQKTGKRVDDPDEIQQILSQAIQEDNPFQLMIDDQVFVYYTRFAPVPDLADVVTEGDRLLIAPLDPPIGNIKLFRSQAVHLELFTELHLVEAHVRFLSRPDPDTIELSFPDFLVVGTQKRDSIRVGIDPAWGLEVRAIRPSGLSFSGRPVDLSTGGVCFFCDDVIPIMASKFRLRVVILWPARNLEVQATAILIKHHNKEGETYFRTKFLFESYDEARAIEELTTELQRREIKKREDLFGIHKTLQAASHKGLDKPPA